MRKRDDREISLFDLAAPPAPAAIVSAVAPVHRTPVETELIASARRCPLCVLVLGEGEGYGSFCDPCLSRLDVVR